ncbi:MAG: glycosyltransferase family 4 protein [Alphaproteobacteria bacterium]
MLLMIASFEPRKRHWELLHVFPRIAARFPQVRLLLVGEGPQRAQVEAQVASLGLQRNVIFMGYRGDPEALIALADLCLLTSLREGLPRVLMQYLAAGKPCAACNLPGLGEVLRHGVNGIVTSADMGALAQATVELLENPEKLRRLSQGAAETDLSSWEASLMGARTEAVYRSALDEARGRFAASSFTSWSLGAGP